MEREDAIINIEHSISDEEPEIQYIESPITSSTDMHSVDVGEITETPDTALMSTSAVLFYCKSKILHPYLKFLAIVGLRPISEQTQCSQISLILSHYHTFQISLLIFLGYILQYMSCFRRDRGFLYNSLRHSENDNFCHSSFTFSYSVLNTLHLIGYIYSVYLFRICDNEHLQNLMERVFLLSSFPPQGIPFASPRKLLKTLWIFIILSFIWITLSVITMTLMVLRNVIEFQWISDNLKLKLTAKILLVLCTLIHDIVQATIITNYCLQAKLLTAHLYFLRSRLLTRTISPLDWMREVSEFKKLLHHLNEVLAPGICLFIMINTCWAFSEILWLTNLDKNHIQIIPNLELNIMNEILWVIAASIPFISAARLTNACTMTQEVGHEIIVRPFLHQETPQEDLNAVLLYASSLRLSANLFRIPITGRLLCFIITFTCVTLIILGMCHYITL